MPSPMSEDQLFKALLKKKPEEAPVKKESPRPAPAPQPAEVYKEKEPVIESPPVKPLEIERMTEEIRNLISSVNMMYGLIRTVIVLVLILIVGIAILLRR